MFKSYVPITGPCTLKWCSAFIQLERPTFRIDSGWIICGSFQFNPILRQKPSAFSPQDSQYSSIFQCLSIPFIVLGSFFLWDKLCHVWLVKPPQVMPLLHAGANTATLIWTPLGLTGPGSAAVEVRSLSFTHSQYVCLTSHVLSFISYPLYPLSSISSPDASICILHIYLQQNLPWFMV